MATATANTITVAAHSEDSYDIAIADTIIKQIFQMDALCFGALACGPANRSAISYGLLMRRVIVRQTSRATYGNIEITLNELGFYDIVGYSTDKWGQPKKVVFENSNLDPRQLWENLRSIFE